MKTHGQFEGLLYVLIMLGAGVLAGLLFIVALACEIAGWRSLPWFVGSGAMAFAAFVAWTLT